MRCHASGIAAGRPARYSTLMRQILGCSCAALLLLTSHAAAARDACVTTTKRPPKEVVVPFAEGSGGQLPEQAVRIEPSETLCLVAREDRDGELRGLRLREGTEEWRVKITLQPVGQTVRLTITNPDGRWLRVGVMRIIGPPELAQPLEVVVVPAHGTTVQTFPASGQPLALVRFAFGPPPPQPTDARGPLTPFRTGDRQSGFSVVLFGGVRTLHLADVNRSLRGWGYAPLRTNFRQFGFVWEFDIIRLRFRGQYSHGSSHTSSAAPGALRVSYSEWDVSLAYDFLRVGGLSAWVSTGGGSGSVTVDASVPGHPVFWRPSDLPDARMENASTIWTMDVGIEQLFRVWRSELETPVALVYSIGYVRQLSSGSRKWRESGSDEEPGTGPAVHISGWRARLGLGIALF